MRRMSGRYRCHEGRDSHPARFNYLSLWLGHSSIQATLIYQELVPNRAGSLGWGDEDRRPAQLTTGGVHSNVPAGSRAASTPEVQRSSLAPLET